MTQPATSPAPANGTRRPALPASGGDGAISVFSDARNFEQGQRMAVALSKSTLVPLAFRGEANIPNVLIAIEMASRIDASVLMVMQSLHVVHGKPGWSSAFLIATANTSGRFTPIRFQWVGTRGQADWGCFAVAKDRESGEPCEGATIDMKMAAAEGWINRDGSKWKTMPQQMLMYRAAAFWVRIYAPELALGMSTSEENSDVLDTTGYAVPTTSDLKALEEELRATPAPIAAKAEETPPPAETPKTETKEPAKKSAKKAAATAEKTPDPAPAAPPPPKREVSLRCPGECGGEEVDLGKGGEIVNGVAWHSHCLATARDAEAALAAKEPPTREPGEEG